MPDMDDPPVHGKVFDNETVEHLSIIQQEGIHLKRQNRRRRPAMGLNCPISLVPGQFALELIARNCSLSETTVGTYTALRHRRLFIKANRSQEDLFLR